MERPRNTETTAWGAASLAGLATGFWGSLDELAAIRAVDRRFEPTMSTDRRERLLAGWHRAVERSRDWAATRPIVLSVAHRKIGYRHAR